MLAQYWGTADVGGCPSFEDAQEYLRPGYGPVDYAYNSLLGRHRQWTTPATRNGFGLRINRVRNASEKAVVWDAARVVSNSKLDRTPWGYPTSGNLINNRPDPNFHARHGNVGNVGWLDGLQRVPPLLLRRLPLRPRRRRPQAASASATSTPTACWPRTNTTGGGRRRGWRVEGRG